MNQPLLAMLGPIGMQEMIVIFLIILLLFGAKKIPELARGIGKGMGEFKKAKTDFEDEIKRGEEQGKSDWDAGAENVKSKPEGDAAKTSSTEDTAGDDSKA